MQIKAVGCFKIGVNNELQNLSKESEVI